MLFLKSCRETEVKTGSYVFKEFSGEDGGIWIVREFIEEYGMDFEKGVSDLWLRVLKDLLEAQRQAVGIQDYVR